MSTATIDEPMAKDATISAGRLRQILLEMRGHIDTAEEMKVSTYGYAGAYGYLYGAVRSKLWLLEMLLESCRG